MMDVWGLAPKSDVGVCFSRTHHHWHALAAFCLDAAPVVTAGCNWDDNDGQGLGAGSAMILAYTLERATAKRIAAFEATLPRDYSLTVETVRAFALFLRNCGGFEIY